MRRLALLAAAVAVATLALATTASAHPLGNFTVNHYAGIELAGAVVYVHYTLDVAEIPTFQLEDAIRAPGYARTVARKLELSVDGRRVALEPLATRVVRRPGAGGLPTLRFDAIYRADASGGDLLFADRLYAERIGWREITVTARAGARVVSSSAPQVSLSDGLRSYPQDMLRSPLDVRAATVKAEPGEGVPPAPALDGVPALEHRGGGFEALLGRGALGPGVILVSLLIAAFWGAVHALTPGHGKALVAGYLVGTKGKPRHAFLLGATVTVTHTFGVFALGLVTLLLSQFIVPEQLYPWLTLTSGLLVVAVGASVLRHRLRSGSWADQHHHDQQHGHAHDHDHHHHDHDHHHHHHHDGESLTSRSILGVGVAAGLLPCPSALVVLLSAIAVHRIGFGFALIAAFSLGLAATITAIGLVAVVARRAFSRVSFEGRVVRALPALSALVILGVGVALTVKALPGVI